MSRSTLRFVDACLAGDCLADEIDDFVDLWHEGESQEPLSEFLGLTPEEYALWVEKPESLEWILYARSTGRSIFSLLEEMDSATPKIAARSLSPEDASELIEWLRRTRRI